MCTVLRDTITGMSILTRFKRPRVAVDYVERHRSISYRRAAAVSSSLYLLQSNTYDPRDDPDIANGLGSFAVQSSPLWFGDTSPSAVRSLLTESEDGRLFSPDFRPAQTTRRSGRVIATPSRRMSARGWRYDQFRFESSPYVITCIRRKRRREVLFAKRRARPARRPRRNAYSNVWCR